MLKVAVSIAAVLVPVAEALAAVPALLRALQDRDRGLSLAAAEALSRVDPENGDAIPLLVERLATGDEYTRGNAAHTLSVFRTRAAPAVPALAMALRDRSRFVRGSAAIALGMVGRGDRRVSAALVRALGDPDRLVRYLVAGALADADPGNSAAVPLLAAVLLEDRSGDYLLGLAPAAREAVGPFLTGRVMTRDGPDPGGAAAGGAAQETRCRAPGSGRAVGEAGPRGEGRGRGAGQGFERS